MNPDQKTVLIVSPQASRIGHGALHGQRTLAAFAEFEEWNTIFLTGAGFTERVSDQHLYGEIIEADIDFGEVLAYDGPASAILWGVKRRKLQQKLFQIIDELLEVRLVDAVLALDGDVSVIYECWRRNFQKHPSIAWVTAHSTLDFWFTRLSVRSIFKWRIGVLVKRMIEGMGATILYADGSLHEEFLRRLKIPDRYQQRIVRTDYGCDPNDLRLPRRQARQSLGIPEDARVALFFGLLRADKRPDLAIKAVAEAIPQWWLMIAGKPYSYQPEQLRSMVQQAGLTERSILKFRYLDEDEIRLVYSAADVLIMTHERKTLSNSGILSLARSYRLPVLISGLSYLGQMVKNEETGLVCPDDKAESYTAMLQTYYTMPIIERQKLAAGIEQAAQQRSFIATVRAYTQALDIASNNLHAIKHFNQIT